MKLCWIFLICLVFISASCKQEPAAPPNILFIAIDDLKPTLGCYGDLNIHSPHIDELAARGTVFMNNHCQQAVCGPSRASLLTGRYPDEIAVWGFYSIREHNPDIVTLPQHFRNNGYTTVNISKIFDYRTVDKGMDTISWSWPSFPSGDKEMLSFYPEECGPVIGYFYQSERVKEVFKEKQELAKTSGENPIQLTHAIIKPATECLDLEDNAYKDGVFAEKAMLDMKRLATEGKPFFLAVGFERPHLPWTAPKKYWDLYDRNEIELETFRGHAENDKAYYYGLSNELRSYTDEEGNDAWGKLKDGIPLTEEEQKLLIHGYQDRGESPGHQSTTSARAAVRPRSARRPHLPPGAGPTTRSANRERRDACFRRHSCSRSFPTGRAGGRCPPRREPRRLEAVGIRNRNLARPGPADSRSAARPARSRHAARPRSRR